MYTVNARYDSIEKAIDTIKESYIVIGIPSRNVEHTITYVLHNVIQGLQKYYEGIKSSIIICDGLSTDNTVDIVNAYRRDKQIPITIIPNTLSKGKGGAMKLIVDLVAKYSIAESLIFLDSDLRSITPEWIALMVEGTRRCGFVTPYYCRHKYDATITNFMARPLTTMAYGIDINQPIGGDFGLNSNFIKIMAENELWSNNPWSLLFGVDIFLTHTALAYGIQVCEANLKTKIHEAKDPAKKLKGMFIEVTGSLYSSLIEYSEKWANMEKRTIEKPPLINRPEPLATNPLPVKVSIENAKLKLMDGLHQNRLMYQKIFPDDVMIKLYRRETVDLGIDRNLWFEIIYYSLKYFIQEPRLGLRKRMLESLFYLWQGRLYNFYRETVDKSDEESYRIVREEAIEMFKRRSIFVELVKKYIDY